MSQLGSIHPSRFPFRPISLPFLPFSVSLQAPVLLSDHGQQQGTKVTFIAVETVIFVHFFMSCVEDQGVEHTITMLGNCLVRQTMLNCLHAFLVFIVNRSTSCNKQCCVRPIELVTEIQSCWVLETEERKDKTFIWLVKQTCKTKSD